MPVKSYRLGPGQLFLGETGSEVDYAAQLKGAKVTWSVARGEATPVLSGEELPGDIDWTATLSGEFIQDLSTDGIVDWTWTAKGTDVPFRFIPNTAQGKEVAGVITVTPLDIGGDQAKARPTSSFEWSCVGEPTFGAAGA